MVRYAMVAVLMAAMAPAAAEAQSEQQQLVDRSTLAAQQMLNDRDGTDAQSVLRRARAAMICPQIFRAGFLLGGQGGSCVLVARDGAGSWSAPAFYGMGGGSIGFQAGVQDAEVMLIIMSDRGLNAVMDSQFKLGADASATFVDLGGGVEGATTAALRADIVGFTRARGLFAGISISGSLMSSKSEWNQAYYGRPLAAQQIVVGMEASNPAADALRQVLTRYGAQDQVVAAPALPAPVPLQAGPRSAPIQQQPLAAPRR
ncbi:MAG: lipid-binding SYLF domain-containing protein [Gemmatimonadaceae bacterium]|nr:lipid-binding SYLF domain-containing protein [Acetobacteraceae bacterium]